MKIASIPLKCLLEEAEMENAGVDSPITQAEVTEVFCKLRRGKAAGVDEIYSVYLRSLSWLYNNHMKAGDSTLWKGQLGWWFPSLKRGTGECAPTIR